MLCHHYNVVVGEGGGIIAGTKTVCVVGGGDIAKKLILFHRLKCSIYSFLDIGKIKVK